MSLIRISILLVVLVFSAMAADNGQRLIPLDQPAAAKQVKPSDEAQVVIAFKGQGSKRVLQITCKAGAPGYPGISITSGDSWDVSAFGHIEAKIKNVGEQAIDLAVRVDNPGDWKTSPWNTEHSGIKPGESKTIRVCFGYAFGQPAYALDPKRVSQVLLFVTSSASQQDFQLESLVAGGKPGEKP